MKIKRWWLVGAVIGALIITLILIREWINNPPAKLLLALIFSTLYLFIGVLFGAVVGYLIGKIIHIKTSYLIALLLGGLWGGVSIIIAHTINETAKMEALGIIILPFYISWLLLHAYFDILRIFPILGGFILIIHFFILPLIIGVMFGVIGGYSIDYFIKKLKKMCDII